MVWLLACFETGSHYVAQAGFQLKVFLPQPPKSWGYRHAAQVYRGGSKPSFLNVVSINCLFLCQIRATFMLSRMQRFLFLMNVISQDPISVRHCCLRRWASARDLLQIMFSRWGVAASLVSLCGRLPATQGQLPFVHSKEFACFQMGESPRSQPFM